MKKTVTLPDGTTEVLEGTPEEIAAHEKIIREQGKTITEKRKKPEVLKGAPADIVETGTSEPVRLDPEIIKKLQDLIDATKENGRLVPWYQLLPQPQCWFCGVVGCQRLHREEWPGTHFIYGTSAATVSSDSTPPVVDYYEPFFGS